MARAQRAGLAIRVRRAAPVLAWYWLPVIAWMALILTLSGLSGLPARTNPTTGEVIRSTYTTAKIAHVAEYGVLGALLLRATTAAGGGLALAPMRAALWSVAAAAAFGMGDEVRQSFVPNRNPRLEDALLDAVSALASVTLVLVWRWRRPGEHRRRQALE
jgi:VanZ family protein